MSPPTLSVVLPTLNSRPLLAAHLRSMAPWLDLAHEIVVVDSHSADGTVDFIAAELRHPRVRVFAHPRGLYQSWNHGLAQATGEWLYFSTVGDAIARAQLIHLLDTGRRFGADVVVSKPDFITEGDKPAGPVRWACDWAIESLCPDAQRVALDGIAAFHFALRHAPTAFLGSSASNLYRTRHLQTHPFSPAFGNAGDAAWTLAHGPQTRFALTPTRGSTFRLHAKTYAHVEDSSASLFERLQTLALATLEHAKSDPALSAAIEELRLADLARASAAHFRARLACDVCRQAGPLWFLHPSAWRSRRLRKSARRQLHALDAAAEIAIGRRHVRRQPLAQTVDPGR